MTISVLMVCTGNICRSPMAEGLLLHLLPDSLKPMVDVSSAGTYGLHGNRAEPFAVSAAAAHGADISGHRARTLDATMIRSADLVLAMENHHLYEINDLLFFKCKYASLLGSFAPQRQNPEIEDPYGLPLNAYEACAKEIRACMPGLIDHIRDLLTMNAFLPKGTLRQQIIDLLDKAAMTALDISRAVHISEKDVYRHLAHIQKSVAGQGRKLSFNPSTCLACGFTFTDRRRLTKPGRCPRCRESRIEHPLFRIEAQKENKTSRRRRGKEETPTNAEIDRKHGTTSHSG